jgi:cobalt-zinc-cadmium efflux system outer membrane protein
VSSRFVRLPSYLAGLLAIGLSVLGGARRAVGQDTATPLLLPDLYQRLDTISPRLMAAVAGSRAAAARVGPVRRLPDPQIQLGLMNRNLPGFGLNDPLGMNQIQVMQMVPFPGKQGAATRTAEAQASAASARAGDLRLELRNQVAATFYDLYAVDQAVGVTGKSQALLRDVARTAQSMYAVGDARQTDVLQAQVEVDRMSEELVRMRSMRRALVARLNAILEQPADSQLATPQLPAFPPDVPSLDSLISLAEESRPALAAGKDEIRAAEEARQLAGKQIWPDLQLGAIYGWRPMPEGGTDHMLSLMLGFSIPIWAGSRQDQMKMEAEAMSAAAQADLTAQVADTRGRLGEAYADLEQTRELQGLYRTTLLPQVRATVTASEAAYRVGEVTLMALLDSEMTLYRYEQELFRLQASEGKAWAEMEMLVGRPLIEATATLRPTGEPQ